MASSAFSPLANLLKLLLPQHTAKIQERRERQEKRKKKEEQKLSQNLLGFDTYKRKQPSPITTLDCNPSQKENTTGKEAAAVTGKDVRRNAAKFISKSITNLNIPGTLSVCNTALCKGDKKCHSRCLSACMKESKM